MSAIVDLNSQGVAIREACGALAVARATYYRSRRPKRSQTGPSRRSPPPRSLSTGERQEVLDVLHSERFVDRSPSQVWATLIEEEEKYLCSPRTMYRILADEKEVRERRNQRRRPEYTKPELMATAPNQVWTWDLTKLRGPEKWTYYHLYLVLDLFSRMIVAWMLAHRESGDLARDLFAQAYDQQGVEPGQLIVHADRGSAPTAKTLGQLHADLGIEPSFSRPRVSNDNPFSESAFKTLKYAPGYPDRFGSYEDALWWCRDFVPSYNHEHRHSSLQYLTPAAVHHGEAGTRLARRQEVLAAAYRKHPERFAAGAPIVKELPEAVWINPPEDRSQVEIHAENAAKVHLDAIEDSARETNEAGPEGPAPSVLSPARRSGCSSAEPYPPNRLMDCTATVPSDRLPADIQPPPHPDVLKAKNLGGLGAEPPNTHTQVPST